MAKTVLEYVQYALDTMDSDVVDAIDDTEESLQVSNYLKEAYLELMNREEWEFLNQAAVLDASVDLTQPTKFTIAGDIKYIHSVRYNVATGADPAEMRKLIWLDPEEFLTRATGGSNTTEVTQGASLIFHVGNDRHPTYYTSFDGATITCDAYDSAVESTLATAKTSVWAAIIPSFTVSDSFTPLIPAQMEPLLQATLNSIAHLYLKQSASAPDETRTRRQLAQARRSHSKVSRKQYYTRKFGRR